MVKSNYEQIQYRKELYYWIADEEHWVRAIWKCFDIYGFPFYRWRLGGKSGECDNLQTAIRNVALTTEMANYIWDECKADDEPSLNWNWNDLKVNQKKEGKQ